MSKFFETFGGRKVTLCFVAIVGVVVLGLTREVPTEQLLDAIKWILGLGAGSIAAEDGLKAFASRSQGEPPGAGPQ